MQGSNLGRCPTLFTRSQPESSGKIEQAGCSIKMAGKCRTKHVKT